MVSLSAIAVAASGAMRSPSSSCTVRRTWMIALRETSARISVRSSMSSGFLRSSTERMEAAGDCPSCGSTGPSTALGSITISSAASAMSVPPDIA